MRPGLAPPPTSCRSGSPPRSPRRRPTTPASPTSTSGAGPSTCGRWSASSTTRSTRSGSGSSGRASRRSPPRGAPCWWPTTPAPSRRTPRSSCTASRRSSAGPVYGMADYFFRTIPVVGTLWARAGGVPANPDNAYRLLHDQQQLALVFPEGTKGPSKSYTDRYQLRRFGRGGFVEIAMRAGVPVIPIAVVGSEEAMPDRVPAAVAGPGARGARTSPSPPTSCAFGPLGHRRSRSRPSSSCGCSTRSPSTSPPDQERYSKSRVMDEAEKHPGPAARDALRHAARPAQRLVRLMADARGPARPRHRRRHLLGRPDGPGPRGRPDDGGDPRAWAPSSPSVPFERAEFVRADQTYSILNRIVPRHPGRHHRPHLPGRSTPTLVAAAGPARDQRHRHHEPAGGGRRRRLAGAPRGGEVVDPGLRILGEGPEHLHRGQPAVARRPRTRVERSLVEAEALVRDFAEDNPATLVTGAALRQRARHRHRDPDQPRTCRARCARPSSASTH